MLYASVAAELLPCQNVRVIHHPVRKVRVPRVVLLLTDERVNELAERLRDLLLGVVSSLLHLDSSCFDEVIDPVVEIRHSAFLDCLLDARFE